MLKTRFEHESTSGVEKRRSDFSLPVATDEEMDRKFNEYKAPM